MESLADLRGRWIKETENGLEELLAKFQGTDGSVRAIPFASAPTWSAPVGGRPQHPQLRPTAGKRVKRCSKGRRALTCTQP